MKTRKNITVAGFWTDARLNKMNQNRRDEASAAFGLAGEDEDSEGERRNLNARFGFGTVDDEFWNTSSDGGGESGK